MEARDRCQSRIVRAIEQSSFFFLSYISKGESRRSGGHVEREVRATRCARIERSPLTNGTIHPALARNLRRIG